MKTILVHIDYRPSCAPRLQAALGLARRHGAHLTGLYVIEDSTLPYYGEVPMSKELLKAQQKEARVLADKAKLDFDAAGSAGCSVEWRCSEGRVARQVVEYARYADLVVVGQAGPEDILSEFGDLPEQVVLHSARPTLVIPYDGAARAIGKRVLVGWDGSHEAVRAVHDALPLLRLAEHVVVANISPAPKTESASSAAICQYLARHGIAAQSETIIGDDWQAGELLAAKTTEIEADLLVMGAYWHNRLMEFVLGGATRHLLKHMPGPVLMSH